MYKSDTFPLVADDWIPGKGTAVWDNDLAKCLEPENNFFFSKLAKKNKNKTSKVILEEALKYKLLLDSSSGYNYFLSDTLFYTTDRAVSLPIKGIALEKKFSIEAIVKPAKKQATWGVIFTSQNGPNEGSHSFSLEHDFEDSDNWYLAYDAGGIWKGTSSFKFNNDNWNYLVVNVDLADNRTIAIYINGELVLEEPIPSTCLFLQAEELSVGLFRGIRKFNGIIQEISVKNRLSAPEEISNNWNKIHEALK
jgi:hypothetical protein